MRAFACYLSYATWGLPTFWFDKSWTRCLPRLVYACGCSILERICDCPRSVHRTDVSLLQHLFVIVWFIFRFVKETARENYVAKSPWWHLRHLSLDGLFIWLGCLWLNVLISVWSLENSLSRCRTRKDKTWTSTSPGSVLPRTGLSPQRTMRLSRSTLGTWVLMVFTPTNSPLLLSAVSLDPRVMLIVASTGSGKRRKLNFDSNFECGCTSPEEVYSFW